MRFLCWTWSWGKGKDEEEAGGRMCCWCDLPDSFDAHISLQLWLSRDEPLFTAEKLKGDFS